MLEKSYMEKIRQEDEERSKREEEVPLQSIPFSVCRFQLCFLSFGEHHCQSTVAQPCALQLREGTKIFSTVDCEGTQNLFAPKASVYDLDGHASGRQGHWSSQ